MKDSLKDLERDLTIQLMKSLEIKKESQRICALEKNVTAFELSQEDINKCIMKEDPKNLCQNLSNMVTKLKNVKSQKEHELTAKTKDLQNCQKVSFKDHLVKLRKEVEAEKESADDQMRELEKLQD